MPERLVSGVARPWTSPITGRTLLWDSGLWLGVGALNVAYVSALPVIRARGGMEEFDVVISLFSYLGCFATAQFLRVLAPRWVERPASPRTVLGVLATYPAFVVLNIAGDLLVIEVGRLVWPEQVPTTDVATATYAFNTLKVATWIYVALAGAYTAAAHQRLVVRREREAAELQTELARAQVSALRMQLNPHFLFNTLNGIAEMVHERPCKAEEAIAELSDLLRGALKTPAEGATLADELDWLRRYLDLQSLRFEDALDVVLDVPDDLLDARVPGFLLQPLVENAFEHGVARVTRPGQVIVRARREGDRLVIDVVDNGPGLPSGDGALPDRTPDDPGRGIGVSTTRRRLAQAYGERADLTLSDRADGPGVRARVILPADA